jgi:hypothetical protein
MPVLMHVETRGKLAVRESASSAVCVLCMLGRSRWCASDVRKPRCSTGIRSKLPMVRHVACRDLQQLLKMVLWPCCRFR